MFRVAVVRVVLVCDRDGGRGTGGGGGGRREGIGAWATDALRIKFTEETRLIASSRTSEVLRCIPCVDSVGACVDGGGKSIACWMTGLNLSVMDTVTSPERRPLSTAIFRVHFEVSTAVDCSSVESISSSSEGAGAGEAEGGDFARNGETKLDAGTAPAGSARVGTIGGLSAT